MVREFASNSRKHLSMDHESKQDQDMMTFTNGAKMKMDNGMRDGAPKMVFIIARNLG